ncbi:MAG: methyltransferase domain-containing protein [Brevundimonas sp.]|nr:MAG: methyltransferase domain-containing protein [Brevundimonas sp.]
MGGTTFLTTLFFGKEAAEKRRAGRIGKIRDLPDRRLMADTWIPAFAGEGGRILWVGCRAYTATDYAALETNGAEVWTTDIDPDAGRWGRAGRHRTGDICEIDTVFPDLVFDAILCNGVFGYGVDDAAAQQRAMTAMAAVLRPGGRLLLGWNTDKTSDPLTPEIMGAAFQPTAFADQPSRVRFDTVTHVYDSLRRA